MRRGESMLDVMYFRSTRQRAHRRMDEDWYIENNFQLFAAMGLLRRAFPESKIAHVVRDGRHVVRSYLNRGRYITSDHITAMDVRGDRHATDWAGWSPIQKNAWFWATVNRHAREQGADVTIRFEDLFNGTTECLEGLLTDLGAPDLDRERAVTMMDRPVNTNREEEWPPFEEWSPEQQKEFFDIAGDEMAHWGYV